MRLLGARLKCTRFWGLGFRRLCISGRWQLRWRVGGCRLLESGRCRFFYKERQVGTRRVDFLVDQKVVVELKAIGELEKVQLAQAINYLEAFGLEVGLLLNFGAAKLEFRRVVNSVGGGLG